MFEQLFPKLQTCTTCGLELDVRMFHWRRNRKGEKERRKQCRVCVMKSKGKPGNRVRPS